MERGTAMRAPIIIGFQNVFWDGGALAAVRVRESVTSIPILI